MSPSFTGVIVGYDPGGENAHGLARLDVHGGKALGLITRTAKTLDEALAFVEELPDVIGIGVDTLTCWSTGPGGWRPADRWLRARYPRVANSVVSPNYLSGAMGTNGMAFLLATRKKWPDAFISEAHPKVLLFQLAGIRHDYDGQRDLMDRVLERALELRVAPGNDHEWDAALSAYAALEGLSGRWKRDLHKLPTAEGERLIWPAGETAYCWPD